MRPGRAACRVFSCCTLATRAPAASQPQSASAITKQSQRTKSFIDEGVICEGCFTQRLRCRWLQSAWQLAQIATGSQAALHDDYSQPPKYSKEAMQFCRSKRQQAGLPSPPGFPAISLLLPQSPCSRLCSFFGKSAFYGRFLHLGPVFSCSLQGIQARSGERSVSAPAFEA